MSGPHPHTSAFVRHFHAAHPHLSDALAAHMADDPDGFAATVAEWADAGKDPPVDHSDEPHDLSHADARRLLAVAMADAHIAGDVPDELHAAYKELAADGHLAAVLGLHPEDHIQKAWDAKLHPRNDAGRFISKGDIEAAKADPEKAKELLARTTKPAERAKLEKVLAGHTAPGQSKGDDRKQATREKKEKVQASRTRAAELAAKATRGEATSEELAELADHLPALNVKQLRQVRAALYAKLGGVTRRAEILHKIKTHAQDMAGGNTQHARLADERAQEREAKRNRVRAKIKEYGFLRPSDSEFQAHFGSMADAVKDWGMSVGLFRKDGNGFDEVAERMAKDGHFTVGEHQNATDALWEALTQDAVSMHEDAKDEYAAAEEAYYKALEDTHGKDHGLDAHATADQLFSGDDLAAARRVEESVAQAVADDPYGAGGSGADLTFDPSEFAPDLAGTGEGLSEPKADQPAGDGGRVAADVLMSAFGAAKPTGNPEDPNEVQAEFGGRRVVSTYDPDKDAVKIDFYHAGADDPDEGLKIGAGVQGGSLELARGVKKMAGAVRAAGRNLVYVTDERRHAVYERMMRAAGFKLQSAEKAPEYDDGQTVYTWVPAEQSAAKPAESISQKPLFSDAGKQPDSGKQNTPEPAPDRDAELAKLIAEQQADDAADGRKKKKKKDKVSEKDARISDKKPPQPAAAKAEEKKQVPAKSEQEQEREERAKIDAANAQKKQAAKQKTAGDESAEDDPLARPPEDDAAPSLKERMQADGTWKEPAGNTKGEPSKFDMALVDFDGDTVAERLAAVKAAPDDAREEAARNAGMTLAQFDAEVAKRLAKTAGPSR